MNGKRWFTTAFCLPAVMVVLIGAASATLHQECDSHFFGGKSKKEKERLESLSQQTLSDVERELLDFVQSMPTRKIGGNVPFGQFLSVGPKVFLGAAEKGHEEAG